MIRFTLVFVVVGAIVWLFNPWLTAAVAACWLCFVLPTSTSLNPARWGGWDFLMLIVAAIVLIALRVTSK